VVNRNGRTGLLGGAGRLQFRFVGESYRGAKKGRLFHRNENNGGRVNLGKAYSAILRAFSRAKKKVERTNHRGGHVKEKCTMLSLMKEGKPSDRETKGQPP